MSETGCRCCGLAMAGGPSMGGVDLCGWCDSGYNRDGTKWDMAATVRMIGRGSIFRRRCTSDTCDRVSGHPGEHLPTTATPQEKP